MWPQVTQFETRDRLIAEQLELPRIRRAAAARSGAKPVWRRVRHRLGLLQLRVRLGPVDSSAR